MNAQTLLEAKRLRAEGLGSGEIARRLGVSRRAVTRAVVTQRPEQAKERKHGGRPSVLEGYRGFLLGKLEAFPEIRAKRLFGILTTMGYKGKYGAVKEYVSKLRPSVKRAYHTLRFSPGEMAQVDWAYAGLMEIDGQMRRTSLFVMTLGHSRMLYADLVLGESMEFWLSCHWNAFKFFGSVPGSTLVDNCKVAVESRLGGHVKFNRAYEDFASVCGFKIAACHPYSPNEKGMAEKNVAYLRSGFLEGRGAESFEGRRNSLSEWLATVANCRRHGATGKIPAEVFLEEERAAMRPLPLLPPPCGVKVAVQANSQFRVVFETNKYSVPPRFAGRRLTMDKHPSKLEFFDGEKPLCSHLRRFGRQIDVLDPAHDLELRAKSKGTREQRAVAGILRMGDGSCEYLAKLRDKCPDWLSHIERILALEQIHGHQETARAVRDALQNEAFHSQYIGYLLNLRANPRPEAMPLQLLRGDDILKLSIPEPDLSQYEIHSRKNGK
jgi:transposase